MTTPSLTRLLRPYCLAALPWVTAQADSGPLMPWVVPPAYTQECAACHTGADQGIFNDDNLRLLAGLTPRQQRAWND